MNFISKIQQDFISKIYELENDFFYKKIMPKILKDNGGIFRSELLSSVIKSHDEIDYRYNGESIFIRKTRIVNDGTNTTIIAEFIPS